MKRSILFLLAAVIAVLMTSCFAEDKQPAQYTAGQPEEKLLAEGEDTKCEVTYQTYNGKNQDLFLKEGDKLAVISPSTLPGREQTDAVISGLKAWGYVPVEGKYVCVETRTLADIMEDLQWALEDQQIKAIFCVRGGYGASEVADVLSSETIKNANKLIIGYSDITVYHSAWTSNGIPSIHACMSGTFDGFPESCFEAEEKILGGRSLPIHAKAVITVAREKQQVS